MLKSVKLYGELADRYGKEWSLDINSPSEAVRALCANNPGFKEFIGTSQDRGVGYKISVGGTYLQDPYYEIYNPSGKQEIKIIPAVLGSKKPGTTELIIGLALIWFAPHLAPEIMAAKDAAIMASAGGSAAGGAVVAGSAQAVFQTALSGAAMKMGQAMIYGGIGKLLTPTPESVDETNNYAFNGAANTTRQGVPVPVCYGQLIVGGAVISSGISTGSNNP